MTPRVPGYQSSTLRMEPHAESSWYRRTTVEGSVAGPREPMSITLSSRSTKASLRSRSFFVTLYLDNNFTVDSFASDDHNKHQRCLRVPRKRVASVARPQLLLHKGFPIIHRQELRSFLFPFPLRAKSNGSLVLSQTQCPELGSLHS
jgi:hypothetical protein